jgi:predicted transcriptional regulator
MSAREPYYRAGRHSEERPTTVQELISGRKETFLISENATVHEAARYLRDKQVRAAAVPAAVSVLG